MARILERYSYPVLERVDAGGRPHIVGHVYANPFRNRSAYDWVVETSVCIDCRAAASPLASGASWSCVAIIGAVVQMSCHSAVFCNKRFPCLPQRRFLQRVRRYVAEKRRQQVLGDSSRHETNRR